MRNLMSRPDVFMPRLEGEHSTGDIHFYDVGRREGKRQFELGFGWYRSLFAGAASDQLCGEKTADYLCDAEACDLIRSTCGNVKIVVLLREPLARALSHFRHERHNLRAFGSFRDLFEHGTDIGDARVLSSSYYASSVARYVAAFGKDSVRVLLFEDLVSNPSRELAETAHFLGLSDGFVYPMRNSIVNCGVNSRTVERMKWVAEKLRAHSPGLHSLAKGSVLGKWAEAYIATRRSTGSRITNSRRVAAPESEIDEDFETLFRARHEADVVQLETLLGRDLRTAWWPDRPTMSGGSDVG